MKEADITYAELAKRLKKHGLKETEAGITTKLKRGDVCGDVLSGVPCGNGIGRGSVGGDLAAGADASIPNA